MEYIFAIRIVVFNLVDNIEISVGDRISAYSCAVVPVSVVLSDIIIN